MSLENVQLHLVQTVDDAAELLRWASNRPLLAVDTETTGLNPEVDHVRLVQVGDGQTGWAIPWRDWGGVFRQLADRFEGEWVAHNAKFDLAMLDAEDCRLPRERVHDTRLMAHVLDPTYSTALKRLAAKYVDRRAGALQTELDESLRAKDGWTWATVPVDYQPYWTYAALDCVLTHQLDVELSRRLRDVGAWRAYELEIAASWVCERMERNGFLVDREYTARAYDRFQQDAERIVTWTMDTFGCKPTQNASVAEALIAAGVELDQVTRTGAVKLDKEVLGNVDHELARQVLNHRQLSKLSRTYLRNFLELTSDADPRLHPRINTVGARTGRMSSDHPNLQNLPRRSAENEAAITVRNCLIPSEGNTLLMSDFDQIEMRILAHVTRDVGMHEAFNAPEDFFTVLARRIFDDPALERDDPRRQITKNAGYAKIYGAGPAKFALTAGVSVEQATAVMNQFDMLYSNVRATQNQIETVALQRKSEEGVAYVRSPFTGRRHPADTDRLYTLCNYLIQGSAAEIFKMKLIELDAAGLGDYMIMPVHDEIIMDVPNDELSDVVRCTLEVMNDNEMLSVPITAGADVAQRWGEKETYHAE